MFYDGRISFIAMIGLVRLFPGYIKIIMRIMVLVKLALSSQFITLNLEHTLLEKLLYTQTRPLL